MKLALIITCILTIAYLIAVAVDAIKNADLIEPENEDYEI